MTRSISLASLLLVLLAPEVAFAEGGSSRAQRPNVVTGVAGLPGGLGVQYGHNFAESFSAGARVALWPPLTGLVGELAVNARWFFIGGDQWSFYFEPSLGGIVSYAPSVSSNFSPLLGTVLGFEWRSASGFTAGLSFGNNLVWELASARVVPSPAGYLQLGFAF